MRILLFIMLFLFMPFRVLFGNIIHEIPVQEIQYTIAEVNGFDRIVISGCWSPLEPGSPELPTITYTYLLPRGQRLKRPKILDSQWEEILGHFNIYPKQKEICIEETHHFTVPDPHIYNSSSSYPQEIIVRAQSGNMRGYSLAQITVIPFRYHPRQGRLSILKKLRIEIETEQCETGTFPRRQTRFVKDAFEKFLSRTVVNKSAIHDVTMKPLSYTEENPEDLAPTDLPSLLGPPVDFLIITTNEQVDGYEDFARFKKLMGYNTVVKTVSWVRQHYTGVDDAERIRNFIRDAMEHWGVAYVLMGGDVPGIPTRWFWMEPVYNQWPVHTVTDLYFSDLDGNWNFDGDEKFGESADSLDLYPDVFVGRLPTNSSYEVRQYLSKIYSYVEPINTNIQIKALFFSSDFVVPDDAYQMALRLGDHLPSWFIKHFLNEKPLQDLKDSLYVGYNLIIGLGHGDVNIIRVRTSPTEYATNFFFDSLTNTDRCALMIVSTCYTNPFQSDCLGKHWILNPFGGGIGYIGPTTPSETYLHESYVNILLDSLFCLPLSEALAISKIPFIPDAQWDNWYRVYQFSLSLLGDPTLVLWDSIPLHYNSITALPDTLQVGLDTVTLSIEPAVSGNVIFYKEGETYIRKVVQNGFLECEVKTESAGYLKYTVYDTVLAGRYIPYIDSIMVEPRAPYLVYEGYSVVDTLQNGNGVINPGEDIYLYLDVGNVGGVLASGVSAQIFCADSLLVMVTDTASFEDVVVGSSGRSLTPFRFLVSGLMPDEYDFNFSVVLNYSGLVGEDSFQVVGLAPVLVHFGQDFNGFGDTVSIVPWLANYGHAVADSVYGRLSGYSDTVVVFDSMVVFPTLGVNEVVSSSPDSFWLYVNDSGLVRVNLRVYNRGLAVVDKELELGVPGRVDAVWALGREHSVVLEWSQVFGAKGYRLYRALDSGGPYRLLDNHLVSVSYYEDFGVQSGVPYYYYVVAVDSSMNHGLSSDTVCGVMNPLLASGWPQVVYDYLFSSPNFGDLDLFYPGLEVVVCGKDGNIYAWHYDGTPVLGDGRLFVVDDAVWSSPALGDVNGDGVLEVVFGVRRGSDNLYVIDPQGVCLAGWPRTVAGGVLGSPVLGDVDGDGDLEIFVWTQSADIYAFHHDGTGVYASDGLLRAFPGSALGSLAIGDLNGDDELEIVCCGGSGSDSLYVWDRYGNVLAPFPVYIQDGFMQYSPVLGDVRGDERLEVCFYADSTERVYVVDADGVVCWSYDLGEVADVEGSPIIADVTNDGKAEVICGYQAGFVVFDSVGNILPGFLDTCYHDAKLPVVAEVAEGGVAILVGSADWHLYAYQENGVQALGFPIQCGNRIESSPAVYDLDGDGKLELMVGSFDYKFYVFDLPSSYAEWPRFRYDQYNSGTYKSGNYPGVVAYDRVVLGDVGLLVYPNPFKQMTDIRYGPAPPCGARPGIAAGVTGGEQSDITLKIYDVTGRLVKDFSLQLFDIGYRSSVIWYGDDCNGRKVPAGVYFVRLESSHRNITEKIVKIK